MVSPTTEAYTRTAKAKAARNSSEAVSRSFQREIDFRKYVHAHESQFDMEMHMDGVRFLRLKQYPERVPQ